MASTLVLGSTGMTGSHILSALLALQSSKVSSVTTISRRAPSQASSHKSSSPSTPQLTTHVEKDNSKWESLVSSTKPASQILFSALATTRGAAGSFQNQYVLEHDLNITLAKAARTAGTLTYVLISASGAATTSRIPYSRMKGEIEDNILALDFAHTVILRPGLISGQREESRPGEAVVRKIADVLGWVSGGRLKDSWAQDADVIARAAVRAGLRAQRGELQGKKTILDGRAIMELGRVELTEEERRSG